MSESMKVVGLNNLGGSAGEYFLQDIGGTNAETDWVNVTGFDRIYAIVFVSTTFNSGDAITTLKLEQDIAGDGNAKKDLTTSGSGSTYDYDTGNANKTAGDFIVLESRVSQMDVDGGFKYARLYVAATGNSGTDNVGGFLAVYNYAHAQKQLQGAASAHKVYVHPGSF